MLVANRDFIAVHPDGRRLWQYKGRSRCAEGHFPASAYPQNYDRVVGAKRGGRMSGIDGSARHVIREGSIIEAPAPSRRRRPSPITGLERWRMPLSAGRNELLNRSPRIKPRIEPGVRALAVNFFNAVDGDQREAGFLACGVVTTNTIEVLRAERPAIGEIDRMTFDFSDPPPDVIGHIHTHPSGNCVPSATDLDWWATLRREFELEAYIAVIAVRSEAGWLLVPYVTTFDSADHDRVERGMPL